LKYPIKDLERLAYEIQRRTSEYFANETAVGLHKNFQEETKRMLERSSEFMKDMRIQILPKVQDTLSSIEEKLAEDTLEMRQRITPKLSQSKRLANDPTNPLGCRELATSLRGLKNAIYEAKKGKINYSKLGFWIGIPLAIFLFLLGSVILPSFDEYQETNRESGPAILLEDIKNLTVENNTITGYEKGIEIRESEDVRTTNNTLLLP
jgi:parallel beta-helix repeat protein